jgi:hypothetical protein
VQLGNVACPHLFSSSQSSRSVMCALVFYFPAQRVLLVCSCLMP